MKREFPNPTSIEFGRRLRKRRLQRGYTQQQLAAKLGFSAVGYQTIVRWESGERVPDIAQLEDLCRILNARFDTLLKNPLSPKV